jgi:hypothetical protein
MNKLTTNLCKMYTYYAGVVHLGNTRVICELNCYLFSDNKKNLTFFSGYAYIQILLLYLF